MTTAPVPIDLESLQQRLEGSMSDDIESLIHERLNSRTASKDLSDTDELSVSTMRDHLQLQVVARNLTANLCFQDERWPLSYDAG